MTHLPDIRLACADVGRHLPIQLVEGCLVRGCREQIAVHALPPALNAFRLNCLQACNTSFEPRIPHNA